MGYTFTAWGHPNLLATHKTTIEFTKDQDLSTQGDCIVGVKSNFDTKEIRKIVKGCSELRITLEARSGKNRFEEIFLATTNADFSDTHEIVLRRSNFTSERTLGTYVDRAAIDMDRKLVKILKNPKQKMHVTIEPRYQAIIFDFDNTLEDYYPCRVNAHKAVDEYFKKFDIDPGKAEREMQKVHDFMSHKGAGGDIKYYDRHIWFADLAKRLKVKLTKRDIDALVLLYWRVVEDHAKAFPGAIPLLKRLKKRYKLILMSDSDGERKIKINRIKRTGMYHLFDYIITSNDTNCNKPCKDFYDIITKKFGLRYEACMMVGDKPQVDLELARKLGMRTIWVKKGNWAVKLKGKSFNYVDHEVHDMHELGEVLR